jgi:uncharacterized OB-fold protein
MSNEYQKALPEIDEDNEEFFRSCRDHAMRLQRCRSCSRFRYYPSAICPFCQSFSHAWETVSGQATLYTYTVVHRAPSDAWAADVPYVFAIVELVEGPMMPTNIVGCNPEAVRIGMPLRIDYRDVTDDVSLPMFAPVEAT